MNIIAHLRGKIAVRGRARRHGARDASGNSLKLIWVPTAEIREHKEAVVLSMKMPGLKEKDIQVRFTPAGLHVHGRKRRVNYSGTTDSPEQRMISAFERVVSLPDTVLRESVAAAYQDGVLTLILPKEENGQPHAVETR